MSVFRNPKPGVVRTNEGFVLVEVLSAIAIACFLFVSVAGSMAYFSKQLGHLSARLTVSNITLNLRQMLSNDSALLNSIFSKKNKVFDCFRSKNLDPLNPGSASLSGCEGQTGTLDQLINSSGQEIANLKDPKSGFTSSGEPCDTYGVDPNCNIKARIEVKYVCDNDSGGECLKPQIIMKGSLEMRDPETGEITQLSNLFEVRKDWGAMTPTLIELSNQQNSPDGMAGKTFKLVIIVDNSTSMSTYQAKLSASLDPLLESLKTNNFDLAVHIYSTTQYIESADLRNKYPHPVNSDQQILNLASVTCSNGSKTFNGFCGDGPLSGIQHEVWEMKPPTSVVLPASASEADFLSFKSTILTTVKNMGVSGSDDEQGLCTLARLLTGGNNFLVGEDKAGIIVIANEQDSSKTRTCANIIDRKYDPVGRLQWAIEPRCDADSEIAEATDIIDYFVKAEIGSAGYRLDYTCQTYRDGSFVPFNAADSSTYRRTNDRSVNESVVDETDPQATAISQFGIDINQTCENSGINFTSTWNSSKFNDNVTMSSADCPASVSNKLARHTSCGYYKADGTYIGGQVVSCKISCNNSINYGLTAVRLKTGAPVAIRQLTSFPTNYCTNPLTIGPIGSYMMENVTPKNYRQLISGAEHPNMVEVFKANFPTRTLWTPPPGGSACCREQNYRQPFPVGEAANVYTSVFAASGLTDLPIVDAIKAKADSLLGEDGYFISSIIHTSDPAQACPMDANESKGLAFEELARKVAHSKVVPICASDYSAALDPLKEFIRNSETTILLGNDMIKLNQGSQVVQIYVVNETESLQFPIGGSSGVWPTLLSASESGTEKTYRLDFGNTGYQLKTTDRVFALVANQDSSISIGDMGGNFLTYDQIRSLYRLGLGH